MLRPLYHLAVALPLLVACTHDAPVARAPAALTPMESPRAATLVVRGGVLRVDRDGALRFVHDGVAAVLDERAVPELSRSPDGSMAAWPRRTAAGAEIVVRAMPDGSPRVVSVGLTVADRPVFAPDGDTLVFWGSAPGDTLVGLYGVSLSAGGAPVRVNNRGLAGVNDPRFVPPPVDHGDARFTSPTVIGYTTPGGAVTVDLSQP